jgi:hypothetical protein
MVLKVHPKVRPWHLKGLVPGHHGPQGPPQGARAAAVSASIACLNGRLAAPAEAAVWSVLCAQALLLLEDRVSVPPGTAGVADAAAGQPGVSAAAAPPP